jgi:hypothetical protein
VVYSQNSRTLFYIMEGETSKSKLHHHGFVNECCLHLPALKDFVVSVCAASAKNISNLILIQVKNVHIAFDLLSRTIRKEGRSRGPYDRVLSTVRLTMRDKNQPGYLSHFVESPKQRSASTYKIVTTTRHCILLTYTTSLWRPQLHNGDRIS